MHISSKKVNPIALPNIEKQAENQKTTLNHQVHVTETQTSTPLHKTDSFAPSDRASAVLLGQDAVHTDQLKISGLQNQAKASIAELAQNSPKAFEQILKQSFSTSTAEQRKNFMELAKLNALPMPKIKMVDSDALRGHHGAYTADGQGTILLNRNDSPGEQLSTLKEELGHHFDAKLFAGKQDSTGDEGAIFRKALEKKAPLSESSLTELRKVDDHGTLKGIAGDVEFRRSSSANLADYVARAVESSTIRRMNFVEGIANRVEHDITSFSDLTPQNKTSVMSLLLYRLGEKHDRAIQHGRQGIDPNDLVFRAITKIRQNMSVENYATLLDDSLNAIDGKQVESRLPKIPGVPMQLKIAGEVDRVLRSIRNEDVKASLDQCLNQNWTYLGK